jgi:vacuolar-type H+-ATPase subunit H
LAQTAPAPANSAATPSEARHHEMGRMMPGKFVDGRIAFLKAELKITPAQETQWQQVEAAMRENAKALDQTMTTARQNRTDMDAVHRLELREQFAKVRAENEARLVAAFKPLYASLSPEQQQMANQLVGAHHHGHHRA